MNIPSLLEQLLQSASGGDAARRADLGKYATGAAVGGVLGLLLGTRRGRNLGGRALRYGSVAAIGALAWKAYQEHQARQAAAAGAAASPAAAPAAQPPALPPPQQALHSQALLKAMIAAAKADGHLDEREQGLLQNELDRSGADAATLRWMAAEVAGPADAAAVAAAATGPEMAAEIYLTSLLVTDETSAAERAYLDDLARHLRLAPSLQADLEKRALAH